MSQMPPPTGGGYAPPPKPPVNFDILGEAFSMFGKEWQAYVIGALPILAVIIVQFIGSFGFGMMGVFTAGVQSDAAAAGLVGSQFVFLMLLSILSLAVTPFSLGALVKMALNQLEGVPVMQDAFRTAGRKLLSLIGLSIVAGLAIGFGVMCCILPGVLIAGLLLPAVAYIIAEDRGVFGAMEVSWNNMKPYLWMAAGLAVVLYLISALGGVACYIGYVVTYPILAIGIALLYRNFERPTAGTTPQGPSPYPREG